VLDGAILIVGMIILFGCVFCIMCTTLKANGSNFLRAILVVGMIILFGCVFCILCTTLKVNP
ncbi:hypothetical protein T484DRAFT_1830133, partial [Baffinella frigidus]